MRPLLPHFRQALDRTCGRAPAAARAETPSPCRPRIALHVFGPRRVQLDLPLRKTGEFGRVEYIMTDGN
jgi:hypothetical protein